MKSPRTVLLKVDVEMEDSNSCSGGGAKIGLSIQPYGRRVFHLPRRDEEALQSSSRCTLQLSRPFTSLRLEGLSTRCSETITTTMR